MNFSNTIKLLEDGISNDIFPGYAFAVGNKDTVFVKRSNGYRSLYPQKEKMTDNTLFDVASLTKVMVTTMVACKAIESGRISLNDSLSRFYENCYDKADITILDLLTHQSGISSDIGLSKIGISSEDAIDEILKSKSVCLPKSQTVYSCLNFILLGDIFEKIYNISLGELAWRLVFNPLNMQNACFNPISSDVVATEYCPDLNGYACGVTQDNNARFLGGIAGSAGMFCTLDDAVNFMMMLANDGDKYLCKRTFSLCTKNFTRGLLENRSLGFLLTGDKPTFAGDLLSDGSFGHTGYTGTSILIDKDSKIWTILFTNRIHFGKENDAIVRFRRVFHNSIYGQM